MVPAIALAGISIFTKRKSDDRNFPIFGDALRFRTFTIVSACAFVALLICLSIGRTQPVSFHRYSTFAVPIVILMGVILWTIGVDRKNWLMKIAGKHWIPIAVTASCLLTIAIETRLKRHPDVLVGSMAYAAGMRSIDDAYVGRSSWGYHLPWGAIYPGSRAAYAIVGPHTPIWSLHIHSYCMLPDCQMETFMSFSMRTIGIASCSARRKRHGRSFSVPGSIISCIPASWPVLALESPISSPSASCFPRTTLPNIWRCDGPTEQPRC